MSVWFAIPSKRAPEEANAVLLAWRRAGYKVALWCDDCVDANAKVHDMHIQGQYQGYAHAVNSLCGAILAGDPTAQWIVTGGDDTLPDPDNSPDVIAEQCKRHFGGTFGVMQPTGDRWGDTPESRVQFGADRGAFIDRIAGSPWIGREFARRMYGGQGPYFPEYRHQYVDEELQEVAQRLDAFWQRADLIHRHNHFCRVGDTVNWAVGLAVMPAFLREANSPEHRVQFQRVFETRKRMGFPGHEPIPAEVCA